MLPRSILVAVLSLFWLIGCSTAPISEATGSRVISERIYDQSLTVAPSNSVYGTVSFLRDKGFSGGGCTHVISINGKKAFAIRQGEHMTVFLPPGDHLLGLETGGGLCPNIAISQDLRLSANQSVSYRILLPSDGSLRLTRVK